MVGRTVTRAHLKAAGYETAGITEHEASALVESVLAEITDALIRGETVKLASFGTFSTRRKGGRIGRNPKTGEVALIAPRTVVVFRPSQILKGRIQRRLAEKEPAGQRRSQLPAPEPAARRGQTTSSAVLTPAKQQRRSSGLTPRPRPNNLARQCGLICKDPNKRCVADSDLNVHSIEQMRLVKNGFPFQEHCSHCPDIYTLTL